MFNEKKVVPELRQDVRVDIVTSDDIKIYHTWKFQDFTARYVIKVSERVALTFLRVRGVRGYEITDRILTDFFVTKRGALEGQIQYDNSTQTVFQFKLFTTQSRL